MEHLELRGIIHCIHILTGIPGERFSGDSVFNTATSSQTDIRDFVKNTPVNTADSVKYHYICNAENVKRNPYRRTENVPPCRAGQRLRFN